MAKNKILHIIGGGEYGGAEQYLINVATQMRDSRYEIHLACFYDRDFSRKLREYDIPVHVVLPKSVYDLSLATNIAALIDKHQYSIVHTHGVRANLFGRLAVRKLNNKYKKQEIPQIKLFTTVHSELKQDYVNPIAYIVAFGLELVSQHLTDKFIAISNSIRMDMISRRIPDKKITVVYNGIDFDDYYRRANYDLADEFAQSLDAEPLIGIVGRLQKVKGHEYAIQAMPQIIKKYPNAKLVIVGEGPEKKYLQAIAERLGIITSVMFIGYQDNVAPFLKRLDLFLMPSLSEGLGLSLIEAMAFDVPIVASRVGGIMDVVNYGELVAAQDEQAIARSALKILDNPEQAKEVAVKGRNDIIERFHIRRMITQMEELYDGR